MRTFRLVSLFILRYILFRTVIISFSHIFLFILKFSDEDFQTSLFVDLEVCSLSNGHFSYPMWQEREE